MLRLRFLRNTKEFKNSFIYSPKPSDIKIKINKLSNLKNIDNKFIKQKEINSSDIIPQINYYRKNNNKKIKKIKIKFNKDIIFYNGSHNSSSLSKINKNNSLIPSNQKINIYKSDSMPQILKNNNNNNILKEPKDSSSVYQKKVLKKIINKKINNSFSNNNDSFNHSSINNISGFNSTNNINLNISNNNSSKIFKSSYDNNSSLKKNNSKIKNFSKFFFKSQSDLISSKIIYKHYIKEDEKDKIKIKPIDSFIKAGYTRSIKQLKESYKDDEKFIKKLEELKYNNTIAFKDDFNIFDYQSTLMKLFAKRVSEKNLSEMEKNFVAFNEKNFGIHGPKGRFTHLAEKVKYCIPSFLYEKFRKFDTDRLISRYNYYKKINNNIKNNILKKYELKKKKKNKTSTCNSKDDINKENNNSLNYNSLNKSK